MSNLQGVIFDLDNTLVLSEKYHFEITRDMADELGVELDEETYKEQYLGRDMDFIAKSILTIAVRDDYEVQEDEIERFKILKKNFFKERVADEGLEPVPGVVDFIKTLKKEDVPYNIATSSEIETAEIKLFASGLIDYFDEIVSVKQVQNPKPAPDIFIEAARKLQTTPEYCIVFEDTDLGVEAAVKSGAYTIALTTSIEPTIPALKGMNTYINDYTEIKFEELKKAFDDWQAEKSDN